MATIERDFGLKADEQGFLLGVKKLGQDVAQIDTNVEKILDILGNYAPVKDFKQALHQSRLTQNTAKIAANSATLLQSQNQIVTLLSSRSQGQNEQDIIQPPQLVDSGRLGRASDNSNTGNNNTQPPQPIGEQGANAQPPQIVDNERVNNRTDTNDNVGQNNARQRDAQALHQSKLTQDTAKIAANSATLLQSQNQVVTLLSSRSQGQNEQNNGQQSQIISAGRTSSNNNNNNASADNNQSPLPQQTGEQNTDSQSPQIINNERVNNRENNSDIVSQNNARQRDSRGRFVGSGEDEKKGFLGKIVQAIKNGFSSDTSSIDPSIEAMREVGQVLEPVGKVAEFTLRPFGFRSKEKNKPLSREEERHNRRQIRLLERIARMSSRGGSSGGNSSFAGGLLGGLLSRGGGLLKGAGGLLLRAVMSPVTLLAGAFFGGYKLGEIIAPKISEWTDSLIKADIPKRISNAWDTFTGGLGDYFKEKINNIKENTKEVVNDAEDTVGSVGDFAAYQTDRLLAKLGNKEAIERLAQRDRGEIGFTPQNYKAKTTNNTSLGQVAADTGEALSTQPSTSKYAPLLDEIAKGESKSGAFGTSGYDAVYGGAKVKPSKPVSQMTIGEVKEYQKQLIKAGSGSSAVGRYQFIKNDDAFAKMTAQAGLKDTDIFDATAQDRLAVHYMGGEKKVDELLKTGNDAALANVVARQWASMQNASGRGNYDGDKIGNFARHGGISAMQKARQQILANEAQPKPTNTVLTKAPTPIVNGLTTTPLAMLPKAQTPAFSLMRPTQQVEVKPSVISQTQHKIAAPQIPKPESVKEPIGTPSPMMVRNVDNGQQITQNLSDRHLAHLVTGGLGMTDRWIR